MKIKITIEVDGQEKIVAQTSQSYTALETGVKKLQVKIRSAETRVKIAKNTRQANAGMVAIKKEMSTLHSESAESDIAALEADAAALEAESEAYDVVGNSTQSIDDKVNAALKGSTDSDFEAFKKGLSG